jgi:SagB-type dehydrogenase family enzyme
MGDQRAETLAARGFLKANFEDIDFESTDQALKVTRPAQEKPVDSGSRLIPLAKREAWGVEGRSLVDAMLGRQSRRKFSADALGFAQLSFLLFAAQGVRIRGEKSSFRNVPSGGARHPFETYLYIDRVETLDRGLYRYLPLEDALCLVSPYREGMAEELDAATDGQLMVAAAYFIWTAIPYRSEWRYSIAAAKLVALDAGHLCQNLYLACEAAGCGTCAIGDYKQSLIDRFLGVDGVEEFAVYMAPVGRAPRTTDDNR